MAAPDIPLDAWWGGRVRAQYATIFSGDDRTLTFTMRDRAGSAVSITGTYSFVLASGPSAADGAEVTKTGAVSGSTVAVTLADTDTTSLEGTFWFELTVAETSSGAVSIVSFGKITIGRDV